MYIVRRATTYLSYLAIQTAKIKNVEVHRNLSIPPSSFTLSEVFYRHSLPKTSLGKKPEKEIIDIIDSKIEIQESIDTDKEIPKLHFSVKDSEEDILLEREYENEKINVQVDRQALSNRQDNISMTVTIDKDSHISLGFDVRASLDSVQILRFFTWTKVSENLNNTDKEVQFSDLDAKMKKALERYLEIRGIQPSMVKALSELVKDKKMDYSTIWLKELKNFMEI
ncbi:hypothetical protein JCGZ_25117 [Jatropha curcas]|uniref:Uncharacterized protein n=1 Tax=Jatropha curcas TaxID=180498 RepID=A0A067JNZ0_JATCU|nr:uncharacterized protein At2g39795, mitochondrial [Jatropha curcas]KDP24553.1 hypothetical protein JCGZ_25117 [Jatropha curcas]